MPEFPNIIKINSEKKCFPKKINSLKIFKIKNKIKKLLLKKIEVSTEAYFEVYQNRLENKVFTILI